MRTETLRGREQFRDSLADAATAEDCDLAPQFRHGAERPISKLALTKTVVQRLHRSYSDSVLMYIQFRAACSRFSNCLRLRQLVHNVPLSAGHYSVVQSKEYKRVRLR
jgi:hypothetical protein